MLKFRGRLTAAQSEPYSALVYGFQHYFLRAITANETLRTCLQWGRPSLTEAYHDHAKRTID